MLSCPPRAAQHSHLPPATPYLMSDGMPWCSTAMEVGRSSSVLARPSGTMRMVPAASSWAPPPAAADRLLVVLVSSASAWQGQGGCKGWVRGQGPTTEA